jgi:prepilin-type N-terminal cleavage/methylation domain-containing protein
MIKISNKGFTLLEIVTSLIILAGLFFTLLPLGNRFFSKNALEKRLNTIVGAIKFARNKSQFDGKKLILSELSDKNGWLYGMRLYRENTGNYHYEQGDKIIRSWSWDNKIISVEWHGFGSDHYLLFSNKLQESALNGYFSLSEAGKIKRKIIINRLGRVRIEKIS